LLCSIHRNFMTNYKNMKPLLQLLKVKNRSKNTSVITLVKTWERSWTLSCWRLQKTHVVAFIVSSVDEVITIDNAQWISIHWYVVQAWKRILIFFFLEKIGVSNTCDNFSLQGILSIPTHMFVTCVQINHFFYYWCDYLPWHHGKNDL
jgi:hypothetical protein